MALVVALGALLKGCSDSTDRQPSTSPSSKTPASLVSLSLLVFNVEYGGSRATDEAMADVDADDVGLQILSKYPILEPPGADGLYACEVRPGEAVVMINTHLDWTAQNARKPGVVGPVAWPVSEALVGAGLSG